MSNWQEIRVNSKILGHISAGIYRSPGGAIKELVSNAYDADATRVVITTNWPSFDIITCRDNGIGMDAEKFHNIMTSEIGESEKRVNSKVTDSGRPIIGWLGIGMLGIAQICHEFTVISHHKKSKTAFEARVRLIDFLKEKVIEINPKEVPDKPIDVGTFSIESIEYDQAKSGTYVIASDMRSAFVKKFRETSQDDALPSIFSVFLKRIYKERSIKALSDYWQMVWELCVASPIPYVEGVFDWTKIDFTPEMKEWLEKINMDLMNYDFELIVDGLSLRKPNRFPLAYYVSKTEFTTGMLFLINKNVKVYNQNFKLSGYIYLQNGKAIEPVELRGLLVRIRNIAIGGFDPTFFKFPKAASPKFNWISGEIYVEKGLEFALNIDRDSFNEIHPHYVKLKEIIHDLLEEDVFPAASQEEKVRRQEKQQKYKNAKQKELTSIVETELGENYEILYSNESEFPLTIDKDNKKMIQNNESTLLPKSTKNRESILTIAHAFEISMKSNEKNRREKFYKLLRKLLESGLL